MKLQKDVQYPKYNSEIESNVRARSIRILFDVNSNGAVSIIVDASEDDLGEDENGSGENDEEGSEEHRESYGLEGRGEEMREMRRKGALTRRVEQVKPSCR